MALHELEGGEHHVPAPGGEAALVTQQVLHRHQIIIVVLDVAVVFVQNAKGAEDGRFQKHLSLLLKAHDAYGGEELGNGGQAHGGARGHGVGGIGPSVPAGIEEGVVSHDGQRCPFQGPEVHETVHHLVHGRKVGEVVDDGFVEVLHPVYGNLRLGLRFQESHGLFSLAAQA